MVKSRDFNYGGLSVRLYQSEQYGWVTTTEELARGVGYTARQLRNIVESKQLLRKESVVKDTELGKKISLTTRGGPKPTVFWTIEGMTFVAMYLGSATCDQFRTEVLKTIKALESQGFMESSEVIRRLETLERMILQQAQTIAHLSSIVQKQSEELRMYQEANVYEASAAGKLMAAAKKTKHLRLLM